MKPGSPRVQGYNRAMNDSMAQPRAGLACVSRPGWKSALNGVSAVLLALLFLASGIWKITDVPGWAVKLTQARVPESLGIAGALIVGIAETLAGVLLLVPRLRRWGAILSGALLLFFVAYFGLNYSALRGQDCSCFPWLKRAVGPGFFIGDGAMLALAIAAGIWARRATGWRAVVLIAGAVSVFAVVSYGVEVARQTGARGPATVSVEGKPYSIGTGKVFVYFFNPACSHCADAAKRLSQLEWGDTRVVATPVELPQFASQFLEVTGLRAVITSDFETLKKAFGYTAYPYGVAVVDGRQQAALTKFEGEEPAATLRRVGLVR
jgi:uncharacterized membrane protein YphA (DoxX/SURF4 family)